MVQSMAFAPSRTIPVLFAPVISQRVADNIRSVPNCGWVDGAGNCRLRSTDPLFLVNRGGFTAPRKSAIPSADPFSPKSSRIVRAMLSNPMQGWQVRQLSAHPDVDVSVGLVVKVKKALIEEGYAIEHDRLLYLRDPAGLLNDWSKKYPGPAERVPLYVRGDYSNAENTIAQWCEAEGLQYSLAGLSAAWRLAPDVRYNVSSVYVDDRGFETELLEHLADQHGIKRVPTGANLFLWRSFDHSVFASDDPTLKVTSPIQTYLDLRTATGRSEDAAKAIFDKFLKSGFDEAAARAERWRHADD